jgi:multidrug efflux system outer membrane protein
MSKHASILLLVLAAVVSGCSLAPKYVRPAAPVPSAWPSGAAYPDSAAANPVPSAPAQRWQDLFPDAKLQQVVESALTHNRDLRLAVLNVERAQALYGIRRAELLPVLEARGTGSRQRQPADLSASGERATVQQYGVNLGVISWELDFFGRIRSLKNRALEEYLATEQARRSAEIVLVSAVANAYLTATAAREGLHLAEFTLVAQRSAYDLIKRRYDGGQVPELDLYRAQAQVDSARGDVARFTQLAALSDNALQMLVGAPVPAELLPPALDQVTPPRELGVGVPSDVLLRRPDVLQSEALLRAAHADIGAARAAFFPRLSLTAAAGTASGELSGLFGSGSDTWSYAPQVVLPIFDARTWSASRAAKVQQEIAVTQYERAIQVAFREVADALAQQGTVGEQVAAQQSLVDATAASQRLAEVRYRGGIDSYLTVLDAQRSLYAAQQALISLRLARLTNALTLYKVLGGG